MRPLVSVVVPVHNPGRYIEPCVRSLLRQTLSRDRFEVIFVDDGSTDGTGERLNRLAQTQPHVRVMHIPASGAPGRPRNVGLGAALGEYVQFLDADDELAPRALRRLLRMAYANHSDIVLGKFASETMNRRQDLFTRNRPATSFAETPALADSSMGPTKLFRTAMLREHDITFPEGWRWMEDQLFTMRAYLAARVISILGDEPCYFFNRREDEGHISSELLDPDAHAAHLGEVLDEVDAVADPTLRHRLMSRFYRLEVLARLTGPAFLDAPAAHRAHLFERLREVALQRIDEAVLAAPAGIARVRSMLLVEGRLDALESLAERSHAFQLEARIERATWSNGSLVATYRARLDRAGGTDPLTLRDREGTMLLDPGVVDDLVGPVEVGDELSAVRLQASIVDRETSLEWVLPSTSTLSLTPDPALGADVVVPEMVGRVEVDPQHVGPGRQPLDSGAWDLQVRWTGFGIHATGRMRFDPGSVAGPAPRLEPALVGRPVRWIVPMVDRATDELRIAVGEADRLPAGLDEGGRRIVRDGTHLAIELPIATDRFGRIANVVFRLVGQSGAVELPGWLRGSAGRVVVDVPLPPAPGAIPRGRYDAGVRIGSDGAPTLPVGGAVVRDDGRVALVGSPRSSVLERAGTTARWAVATGRGLARTTLKATARRLPQRMKDGVRAAQGSLRA